MNAETYALARAGCIVREPSPVDLPELEIQARLFAGEYGTRWISTHGLEIEVISFGHWNRESGPDFKGACLRIGDTEPMLGDIEVDMDPRDWERHGHATNPAYDSVRLQLFVHPAPASSFARTSDFREILQARLLVEAPSSPVPEVLPGAVDSESALAMICEASEFRLRTKHAAHTRAVSLHGADTALFHGIASGLGYKNNAIPFLLVAQRTGLRGAAGAEGEALLFGLCGFLEPRTFDDGDPVTKDYLRPLWEAWWEMRDGLSRLVLPPKLWKFSGIRPSNHPHRRMGALAMVSDRFPQLLRAIRKEDASGFKSFFDSLTHPFWSHHWNLSAAHLGGELALVGPDRVRDLLINAYFPSLPIEKARDSLLTLRGGTPSGRLKIASKWLTGAVHPTLMRTAHQQQGLLQLFNDFGTLPALEARERIKF